MAERVADYLQGHAPATQGRSYGRNSMKLLAAELDKLPKLEPKKLAAAA